MGSFRQWREAPWALPELDLAGFSIAAIGSSLSELNGRRVLSVVVDEGDGTAVVLALTDAQLRALDQREAELADPTRSTFERKMRSFHRWLAGLELGDNDVLGWHTDVVWVGFVLEQEQPLTTDGDAT